LRFDDGFLIIEYDAPIKSNQSPQKEKWGHAWAQPEYLLVRPVDQSVLTTKDDAL